jgi:peroxiredoxin
LELQGIYPELTQLGGEVVVLSIDDAENAVAMKVGLGLEFPVLYDTDTSVTSEWGLYDLLGDGVSAPATFIIRTDGSIESALIGTSIDQRPTPDSILDVLAALAGMDRATMGDTSDGASGSDVVIAAAPAVGGPVPDFNLPTAGGESISLGDYVGKQNVVFVFFQAWW